MQTLQYGRAGRWFFVTLFSLLMPFAAMAADSPETVDVATTVDAAGAKALFDKDALFVDIRRTSDWHAGRIPGALHLELKKVFSEESLSAEAGKDEEVVFYCNGVKCLRSSQSAAMAVGWGYTKVYYYRLGFPDWKNAGYPTE